MGIMTTYDVMLNDSGLSHLSTRIPEGLGTIEVCYYYVIS